MSQGDTPITIVGNVVADPELKFTPSGVAVANFRVASTPRVYDKNTGTWADGEGLFLTCNVWREAAENVTETLTKGMRVIVTGALRQRSYDNREGQRRTVYEVEVDDVGPSLKWAAAQVTRTPRGGAPTGGPARTPAAGFGGGKPATDPWGGSSSAPAAGFDEGDKEIPF